MTPKSLPLNSSLSEIEKDSKHLETSLDADVTNIDIDAVLDRTITRKFDTYLIPWLFGLWLLAFIDRSNIGNARIDGLSKDLNLTGNKFNIVGLTHDNLRKLC